MCDVASCLRYRKYCNPNSHFDGNNEQEIVDGQWSSWIDTPSSVTCGVGCRLRYRECSNPFPQQGGKKCAGSRNKYVKCLQYDPCPVHGAWSVWSENTCSVTCGVETSLRSRNCSNPHPQYGGNNCTGNSTDHVTCTQPNECPVHGAWSAWSENTCSVTCGVGTSLRSRSCSNLSPQYGGNNCTGNGTYHGNCTQPNECPVEVAPKTTDAPQTSAHFCNLEAVRGSCTYYKVKWSYSGNDGRCTRFWYSGCKGNRNNFDSEKKCDAACRKDVCKLPQSHGPCTREHIRWHFDQTIKNCREFLYGGCRGNKNRFITRAECLIRCGSDGVCQPYEEPLISCLAYIKRYRYSAETGDCEELWLCNGNSNNFETMEACRRKCV